MKAIRFSTLALVAGSLALAGPALATKPTLPAKGGAKAPSKAPKKDRPLFAYNSDCFEMKLPNNFVPFMRVKPYAKEPWLGMWMFVTPKLGTKVVINCSRYEKGDFKKVFLGGALAAIKRLAAGWKQDTVTYDKDGPRNVGSIIGTGMMQRFDRKTGKSGPRPHIIHQFFRRSPDRNLQVRITIATSANMHHRLEKLATIIGDSLSIVDRNEKEQMKKKRGLK